MGPGRRTALIPCAMGKVHNQTWLAVLRSQMRYAKMAREAMK